MKKLKLCASFKHEIDRKIK